MITPVPDRFSPVRRTIGALLRSKGSVRPIPLVGVALTLAAAPCSAQRIIEDYVDVGGSLRIGPEPDRRIPMTERGYSLLLPENDAVVAGVAVFIDPRRFQPSSLPVDQGSFDAAALGRKMAVLHITTGNPLDFLFGEGSVQEVAERIGTILRQAGLDCAPVFLAGLSLGGTRALRLAEFLAAHPARAPFGVSAVAIVDAPLDMERLWESEHRAADLGFHPASSDEGRWVTYLLEENLGGPPSTASARYAEVSPYSQRTPEGGSAVYLRGLPIRAYHEPDVDWWIENRRKSYYDMNSLDLAALINQLRILGNEHADLVTTHAEREGYSDGASPHTWSIVDNRELVSWFLSQTPPSISSRSCDPDAPAGAKDSGGGKLGGLPGASRG